jgi:hypothetical protein
MVLEKHANGLAGQERMRRVHAVENGGGVRGPCNGRLIAFQRHALGQRRLEQRVHHPGDVCRRV